MSRGIDPYCRTWRSHIDGCCRQGTASLIIAQHDSTTKVHSHFDTYLRSSSYPSLLNFSNYTRSTIPNCREYNTILLSTCAWHRPYYRWLSQEAFWPFAATQPASKTSLSAAKTTFTTMAIASRITTRALSPSVRIVVPWQWMLAENSAARTQRLATP